MKLKIFIVLCAFMVVGASSAFTPPSQLARIIAHPDAAATMMQVIAAGGGGGGESGGEPMAVEFISGTGFAAANNDTSGSQGSITIPSDATAIVVAASLELVASSGGKKLTALNWDNSGYDFGTDFIGGSGDNYPDSGVEIAVMTATNAGWPGTGSGKTLYWTHVDPPNTEPTKFWIGFFKNVDQTTPLNATTWTDGSDDDSFVVTHTSSLGTLASGDYGLMATYCWQDESPSSGQTLTYFSNSGDTNSLYVAGDVDDSSIVVSSIDYPISCAFSLKAE